jgi:hypothetical protein
MTAVITFILIAMVNQHGTLPYDDPANGIEQSEAL